MLFPLGSNVVKACKTVAHHTAVTLMNSGFTGQVNKKKTERSSYLVHGPALYMAQPCGASNNGAANNDPNARRDATHEGFASADLITIYSALEETSTCDLTCSADTSPSTEQVILGLKRDSPWSPHLVMP